LKKYKFRLQTVLNIKEKVLEEKMLELSKVVEIYNKEKETLQNLEDSRTSSIKELNKMYENPEVLDIAQVNLYKNYLYKLGVDIKKQQETLERVQQLMEQKQQEVNEALKEKKIFEKLKENEEKAFYKLVEKKESIETDDIAISRYNRN